MATYKKVLGKRSETIDLSKREIALIKMMRKVEKGNYSKLVIDTHKKYNARYKDEVLNQSSEKWCDAMGNRYKNEDSME